MSYYQSDVGKIKKGFQNEKRRGESGRAKAEAVDAVVGERGSTSGTEEAVINPEVAATDAQKEQTAAAHQGFEVAPGRFVDWLLVEYLGVLTGLLEGRVVALEEVKELLKRVMRQHSMAPRRKIDHILFQLHEHPP